jgi:hypothetical protein
MAAVVSLTAEDCRAVVCSCAFTVAASCADIVVTAVILVTRVVVIDRAMTKVREVITTTSPAPVASSMVLVCREDASMLSTSALAAALVFIAS